MKLVHLKPQGEFLCPILQSLYYKQLFLSHLQVFNRLVSMILLLLINSRTTVN